MERGCAREHRCRSVSIPVAGGGRGCQPAALRRSYTEGVRGALARIDQLVPRTDPATRCALLAGMVGALAIARAVNDEELSAAMLRETREFWTRTLAKPRRGPRS